MKQFAKEKNKIITILYGFRLDLFISNDGILKSGYIFAFSRMS